MFCLPSLLLTFGQNPVNPFRSPLTDVTNTPRVQVCINGDNQGTSPNTNPSQRDSTRKRKGHGDDEKPKHPECGRPASYHPDKTDCDPCALWQQSGADPNLRQFHSQRYMRHAGHNGSAIAAYAYHNNIAFDLTYDSCICLSCSKSNKENTIPYWAQKRDMYYSKLRQPCNKHCLFCCTPTESNSPCPCSGILYWGPETWHGEDDPNSWKKYLCVTGFVDLTVAGHANHVCRTHNRQILKIKDTRKCEVCTTKGGGDR